MTTMCDCRKKDGFRAKLAQAEFQTKKEGKTHVVYHMEAVDEFFIVEESLITDEMGICCYYRPNGKKGGEQVEYQKTGKTTSVAKSSVKKVSAKTSRKTATKTTAEPKPEDAPKTQPAPEEDVTEKVNPEKEEE